MPITPNSSDLLPKAADAKPSADSPRLSSSRIAAARLGISRTLLERFLKGAIPVPDAILLKAVDFVLSDAPTPAVAEPFKPKGKPVI